MCGKVQLASGTAPSPSRGVIRGRMPCTSGSWSTRSAHNATCHTCSPRHVHQPCIGHTCYCQRQVGCAIQQCMLGEWWWPGGGHPNIHPNKTQAPLQNAGTATTEQKQPPKVSNSKVCGTQRDDSLSTHQSIQHRLRAVVKGEASRSSLKVSREVLFVLATYQNRTAVRDVPCQDHLGMWKSSAEKKKINKKVQCCV